MIVWSSVGKFFFKIAKKLQEKLHFPCPLFSFECNSLDGYTVYWAVRNKVVI